MSCPDNNLKFNQMKSKCVALRGEKKEPKCGGSGVTKEKLAKSLCNFYGSDNDDELPDDKAKVHVVVHNIDYAGDDGVMLVKKRTEFKLISIYGKYYSGQSGGRGWCDTYKVNEEDVEKFKREYQDYWTLQNIPGLRVDTDPDMSNLGEYLGP